MGGDISIDLNGNAHNLDSEMLNDKIARKQQISNHEKKENENPDQIIHEKKKQIILKPKNQYNQKTKRDESQDSGSRSLPVTFTIVPATQQIQKQKQKYVEIQEESIENRESQNKSEIKQLEKRNEVIRRSACTDENGMSLRRAASTKYPCYNNQSPIVAARLINQAQLPIKIQNKYNQFQAFPSHVKLVKINPENKQVF